MQIVLLSGGSGKRLWPLSNEERSKQFLPLLEREDGKMESMVQRVVRQIRGAGLEADITLATNASQKQFIISQLGPEVDMVLEPERRDTFPAIALACSFLSLAKKCPDDEVVVVMPCDPYTQAGYFETLGKMAEAVERDAAELVLMGIKPTYPSSKYGYVVPDTSKSDSVETLQVRRFTEKPDVATAEKLLEEGAFWNGGVFAFRLGHIMSITRKYLKASCFEETIRHYGELPKISFDYEVAEKAESVAVVPYEGEWKDLGTWNTLTDELSTSAIGNAKLGPNSHNTHIINELPVPVFAEGLEDTVVAASADGILVCKKKETENIKKYVEDLTVHSVKKVFVSGCYDLLHSGHIEFFRQASKYGDLYVGIGSDRTIEGYKHHKTLFPEKERLFMVKGVRYVKDAYINDGEGIMDFVNTVDKIRPDIFVVNADGDSPQKREFFKERNIEYVVLEREPHDGFIARSSTSIKKQLGTKQESAQMCGIPTRLDLAGTWIDQPYVSQYAPGWAITISLEPTFEVRERCGLSTSTRNLIKKIWPYKLPEMDSQTLARLVFCFENNPERRDGFLSGAQDAIGICVPGLCRHWYDNGYWPTKIETCDDAEVLDWLENHLCMIPMEPRPDGCSVVGGADITEGKVKSLAAAADDCWDAIKAMNLSKFALSYKASFEAQTAMFPAMIQGSVRKYIDEYSSLDGVLAWKMPGAGGGGYLALVVDDATAFRTAHPEAIRLKIRRA